MSRCQIVTGSRARTVVGICAEPEAKISISSNAGMNFAIGSRRSNSPSS